MAIYSFSLCTKSIDSGVDSVHFNFWKFNYYIHKCSKSSRYMYNVTLKNSLITDYIIGEPLENSVENTICIFYDSLSIE